MCISNKKIATLFIVLVCASTITFAQDDISTEWSGTWNMAWSSDGEKVALASWNGMLQIVDREQNVVTTTQAHDGRTMDTAWSHDGTQIISAGIDGYIRIWDAATNESLFEHPAIMYESGVNVIALHTESQQLLTSGFSTALMWNTETWQPITDVTSVSVTDMEWSPDGTRVAASLLDGIRLITVEGEQLRFGGFTEYVGLPYGVNWSADGTTLLSAGGRDGSVRLWDVERGEQIRVVLQTDQTITDAVFIDPAGSRAAAISESGTLYLLDTTTGQTLDTRVYDARLTSLAWNPVYDLLAVGGMIPADEISADPDAIPGFLAILPLAEWGGAG
jgi:WD40 repeat protein